MSERPMATVWATEAMAPREGLISYIATIDVSARSRREGAGGDVP
jgi:hypothetical protein